MGSVGFTKPILEYVCVCVCVCVCARARARGRAHTQMHAGYCVKTEMHIKSSHTKWRYLPCKFGEYENTV